MRLMHTVVAGIGLYEEDEPLMVCADLIACLNLQLSSLLDAMAGLAEVQLQSALQRLIVLVSCILAASHFQQTTKGSTS